MAARARSTTRPSPDFRYEIRRFLNFSENVARAAGIEPQQHQALLAIKGRQPAIRNDRGRFG